MSVVPFGCKTLKSFSCLRPLFFCLHLRILAMFFWDRAPTSQVLQSSSLKIPVLADGGFQFFFGFLHVDPWAVENIPVMPSRSRHKPTNWALGLKHNDSCGKLCVSRPQKLTSLRNMAKQNALFRDNGDYSSLKAGNFLTKNMAFGRDRFPMLV